MEVDTESSQPLWSRIPVEGCAHRELRYSIVDGLDLMARVYRPVLRGSDRQVQLPVVVHAVGGGWSEGDRTLAADLHRRLARAGIVSVVPELRSGSAHHHPRAAVDFERALRWVHGEAKTLGIDPAVMIVAGSLSGAHAALTAVVTSQAVRRLRIPRGVVLRWPSVDPTTVRDAMLSSGPDDGTASAVDDYFAGSVRMRRAGLPEMIFDGAAVQLPSLRLTRSRGEIAAPCVVSDELAFAWSHAGGAVTVFDAEPEYEEQVNQEMVRVIQELAALVGSKRQTIGQVR